MIIIGNYNVTAPGFACKQSNIIDSERVVHLAGSIRKTDACCLQELDGKITNMLRKELPNYTIYTLTHANGDDGPVEAGWVVPDEKFTEETPVGNHLGAYMVGIAVNKKHRILDIHMFWMSKTPNEKPLFRGFIGDHDDVDKWLGNSRTPRAVLGMNIEGVGWVFTTHMPLSGGGEVRYRHMEVLLEVMGKITQGKDVPIFICGDMNLFPDCEWTPKVIELAAKQYHSVPFGGTWLGYSYEPAKYQNTYADGEWTQTHQLDYIFSNRQAVEFHTDINYYGDCADYSDRKFASDHRAVIAKF